MLSDHWEKDKHNKGDHALFYSLLKTNKFRIFMKCLFELSKSMIDLMGPYLMCQLIEFIERPDGEYMEGLMLAGMMIACRFTQYVFSHFNGFMHHLYSMSMHIGLSSIIYEKILKLTPSTNKKYDTGDILNFIHQDSGRAHALLDLPPYLLRLIAVGVISFYSLIAKMGLVVSPSLLLFVLLMVANYMRSKVMRGYHEAYSKAQDERI